MRDLASHSTLHDVFIIVYYSGFQLLKEIKKFHFQFLAYVLYMAPLKKNGGGTKKNSVKTHEWRAINTKKS